MVGALATGCLLALVAFGAAPASAQTSQAPASAITVSFTPRPSAPAPPDCTTFPFEVAHAAGSSTQSFSITVTVNRRLCSPVGATAAVYAMPSTTQAWPQTLSERRTLTFQEAGTYVVSFAKGCAPQQFDLLAGTTAAVTPQVIAPSGPWHGPLLFPFDLATSLQWRGCGPDPVIPEFPAPAAALGAGAVAALGAVWWRRRHAAPVGA